MPGLGRSTVFIFLLTAIQVHSRTEDPVGLLLKLVSRYEKKPLVVYMDSDKNSHNSLDLLANGQATADDGRQKTIELLTGGNGALDDNDDGETLEENAKNQAKNLFYEFLRSSPDTDNSALEDTKQVLRQALISRCGKVQKCIKTCKKKKICPEKCKIELDEESLCDPPKPLCKKPRCGKTMPPRWL